MPNIGTPELIIGLIVIFLLFGAKRMPEMARGIGQSLKIFKSEMAKPADADAAPAVVVTPAPAPAQAPTAQASAAPQAQPATETPVAPAADPEPRPAQ